MATHTKGTLHRTWNSDYCNIPLKGSPIKHKPDIILVDTCKVWVVFVSRLSSIPNTPNPD
jgi:hypothetical protein